MRETYTLKLAGRLTLIDIKDLQKAGLSSAVIDRWVLGTGFGLDDRAHARRLARLAQSVLEPGRVLVLDCDGGKVEFDDVVLPEAAPEVGVDESLCLSAEGLFVIEGSSNVIRVSLDEGTTFLDYSHEEAQAFADALNRAVNHFKGGN